MTITACPLLWILWIDARELDGWEDTDKAIENCKAECLSIESTGRVIYENDDRLVLVSDMSEDGEHVSKQMIIPKSAVIERKAIGLRTPAKDEPSKKTYPKTRLKAPRLRVILGQSRKHLLGATVKSVWRSIVRVMCPCAISNAVFGLPERFPNKQTPNALPR